jgi:opacity protein-like surface antigen
MVRTLVLLCSILVCGLPLWSQSETPPLELYGGYSHVGNYGIGLNGWLATATYNVDRWFGVEGDANGNYGTKNLGAAAALLTNVPNSIHSRMHNFNFGPRIAYRPSSTDRYDAFGHVLFGASHTNVSASGVGQGDTAFSWILGGGADYNFSPSWAARFQLDFLRTHFFNTAESHGRVGIGLVYRFNP